jgi:hypothetical protein
MARAMCTDFSRTAAESASSPTAAAAAKGIRISPSLLLLLLLAVVVVAAAAGEEERGRVGPHNVVDEVRTRIEALARLVKVGFRYRDADRARSGQEHHRWGAQRHHMPQGLRQHVRRLKNKPECVLDGRLPIAVLAEENGWPDRGHVRDGGTPRSAAKEGGVQQDSSPTMARRTLLSLLLGPDGRARHPTARDVRCASPFLSPRLQHGPWQVARFSIGSSRSRGPMPLAGIGASAAGGAF